MSSILSRTCAAGILLALPVLSQAAEQSSASPFSFTAQAGITMGGDTLVTTYFVGGGSDDVDAGAMIYFGGGFNYRIRTDLELRTTINYFVADSTADNGDVTFDRIPLEVTLGKSFGQHRLALGLTRHFNPKLKIDVPNIKGSVEFEDATGPIIEYGYRLGTSKAWLTVRYVDIAYKVAGVKGESDGSHFGIGLAGSF